MQKWWIHEHGEWTSVKGDYHGPFDSEEEAAAYADELLMKHIKERYDGNAAKWQNDAGRAHEFETFSRTTKENS